MRKSNGSKAALETSVRACKVELTEAELVVRGAEMAECEVQIEKLKTERSELGRQIRAHEKRRNELGHTLEQGTEERELLCSWEPDYAKNVFRLTRPDKDEVIDTRPMTAEDRTSELPFDDGSDAPPPRTPKKKPAKKATTQNANA